MTETEWSHKEHTGMELTCSSKPCLTQRGLHRKLELPSGFLNWVLLFSLLFKWLKYSAVRVLCFTAFQHPSKRLMRIALRLQLQDSLEELIQELKRLDIGIKEKKKSYNEPKSSLVPWNKYIYIWMYRKVNLQPHQHSHLMQAKVY